MTGSVNLEPSGKSAKISVIVPVYNVSNYKENLSFLHQFFPEGEYELIFVDDGTGKGAAIKRGLALANGEYVVMIDGDLQISPTEVQSFFKIMDVYNADAVIGNKRHPFSTVNYTLSRKIISHSYNEIVRLLFGFQLRDSQCGLKIFKRAPLEKIMSRILVKQYAFDIEVLVALKDNGFRVVDAPVYVKKTYGKGSVSIKNILNTLKDTLAVWHRRRNKWYQL